MLMTKEHYELIDMFDRLFKHERLDKEDKSLWKQGNVYQDGHVNNLFLAFRHGFAYGRTVERLAA